MQENNFGTVGFQGLPAINVVPEIWSFFVSLGCAGLDTFRQK